MSYRIGSFNVHNMGRNASNEKIDAIAKIIRNHNLDIIALQEVFCNKSGIIIDSSSNCFPVSSLLTSLGLDKYGGKWKAFFAAPLQARDAKEGYVFIWNSGIQLPKIKLMNGSERIFYPRIYNQYKLDKTCLQQKLIRNPLFARFIPTNQPMMEFRIINTHIRYSGCDNINSDNQEFVSLNDIALRKNEFNVLTKTIYPKIADSVYGVHDAGKLGSIYTIMIGDYNLNLNRKWTNSPYIDAEEFEIDDHGIKKHMITDQESLTTLKMITENNKQNYENEQKFANNYDHITYDKNKFSGTSLKVNRLNVVHTKYAEYRKNISDHIPICIDFNNK